MTVAKPRRGYLFPLDARVLSIGAELHRTGHDWFYGLEIAQRLGRRRCYRLTAFRRESVLHARLGRRVFGRYRRRDG
jgi:hypothetical protein